MEDGEFDPTKTDDKGTTGGASGGGDDNPQDWALPKAPDDTSGKREDSGPEVQDQRKSPLKKCL